MGTQSTGGHEVKDAIVQVRTRKLAEANGGEKRRCLA